MNLEVGSTIGDYQVIDILGAGGIGQVYKVRNVISNRIEAMKVLLPDIAADPDLADRFVREVQAQSGLEHPNIAALHTALPVDNQLLLLMEYVEGVTLAQKLKDGPVPAAEAVDYIRQVLAALEFAHAHGVVHRDIKPANMMLTPGGAVKLMDFGIAKGAATGSLYYMSPEQIQGAATPDPRSDLYSVGVSLYELVTGKRPFDGDSEYAIMAAHLEKTPVPPAGIDPRLPPLLNDLILMSVSKDPHERFQSAAALSNALGNVAVPVLTPLREAAATPAPTPVPELAAAPIPEPVQEPTAVPAPPPAQEAAAAPVPAPVREVLAAPVPEPPHVAEPAAIARPRSRRGLWMALGAVAAALAVVGIIEFAPHKGTKAAPQIVTQTNPEPAPATPMPAAEPQPAVTPPAPAPAPAQAVKQAPVPAPSSRQARQERPASATSPPPSRTPAAEPPRPPASAPVEARPAAAVQPQQPAAPSPTPAQLQEAREQWTMLNSRATGIRVTLDSLQRSQAASGLNMNSRLQQPAHLVDAYMEGANAALNAGDLPAAKDFMQKAERQIETLEKALNR